MKHSQHSLRLIRTAFGFISTFALSTNLAFANGFDMQPASVELAQKKPTATVTLTNSGSQDKVIKIQVMTYTDENGHDQMSPSTRLIVHPAQLTLKPGDSQTVKVGIRMSGPLFDEETYRLVLTETKQSPKVGTTEPASVNIQSSRLALLPVTVLPPGQKISAR